VHQQGRDLQLGFKNRKQTLVAKGKRGTPANKTCPLDAGEAGGNPLNPTHMHRGCLGLPQERCHHLDAIWVARRFHR